MAAGKKSAFKMREIEDAVPDGRKAFRKLQGMSNNDAVVEVMVQELASRPVYDSKKAFTKALDSLKRKHKMPGLI